ncbi:hypothetical protein ABZZ17_35525, partial [Streptomyces sp. NPDC006512]
MPGGGPAGRVAGGEPEEQPLDPPGRLRRGAGSGGPGARVPVGRIGVGRIGGGRSSDDPDPGRTRSSAGGSGLPGGRLGGGAEAFGDPAPGRGRTGGVGGEERGSGRGGAGPLVDGSFILPNGNNNYTELNDPEVNGLFDKAA